MFRKVKTLPAFICLTASLFVLSNNFVLAADGKLTNQKAKQLILQLFNKQPDNLEVIGVMEPSQNMAQADIVITNLLIARPKNDAVTAYAFGPGGGTYLWSGPGKANFVHYNDGRWVLTNLDTEVGRFTPKLPTSSVQTTGDAARGAQTKNALASPGAQGGSASQGLSHFLSMPIASKNEFEKFAEVERKRAEQAEGPANRNRITSLRQQAAVAVQLGRWPQVIGAYNQILAIDPEDWNALLMLSSSYSGLHQPDQSLDYAAKALKRFRYSALYAIVGVAYGQKGDKDRFLTWLEKAVDGGSPLNPMSLDHDFPQYRNDPRYKAIIQKYQTASR